jgi:predicted XRE-type DNA-binding protein
MDKYDITNANITTMNIKTLLGLVKSRILSLWNKKFNLFKFFFNRLSVNELAFFKSLTK